MSAAPGIFRVSEKGDRAPEAQGGYAAQWLTKDQELEWDSFVLQHRFGSVYHTTDWKKVVEQAFPHIRGRLLVLRDADSGRILAGLPVYHVSSWLLGSRLVSIPFATVCDPLVTTSGEWAALTPELERERTRTGNKKLVIRAALHAGPSPPSFDSHSHFRHHVLPLDTDFEALCRCFDKHSVRQKARKARRAGVSIRQRNDKIAMAISDALLATTRRRLSLPPMPSRFFASMQNNLRAEHLKIFLAYQNEKPIACHIVLAFKDAWISEYSANADGAISGVNQLLYLETIRQACAAGARTFSFGRTSDTNEGLLSYKRRWATLEENLTDYTLRENRGNARPDAERVTSPQTSRLYVLCKRAIAKVPAPVSRMMGNFCYRHLG